jgi:hypothetical protein
VSKATGLAVCLALVPALREYGIPQEPSLTPTCGPNQPACCSAVPGRHIRLRIGVFTFGE